jgi:hypothetical protein
MATLSGRRRPNGDLADGGLTGRVDARGVNLAMMRADTCDSDLAKNAFRLAIDAGSTVQGAIELLARTEGELEEQIK